MENQLRNSPLVFYIASGPGKSPMAADQLEQGPYKFNHGSTMKENLLVENPQTWNKRANMVQIDVPFNVGFSQSNKLFDQVDSYKENVEQIYLFILLFLGKYEKYIDNYVQIFGSHYDAWMVPMTAAYILNQNKNLNESTLNEYYIKFRVNLKGIGLGNAWINPLEQQKTMDQQILKHNLTNHAHFMLQIAPNMVTCQNLIEFCINSDINKKTWQDLIFGNDCTAATQGCNGLFLSNITGTNTNYWDIRKKCVNQPICYDFSKLEDFLNKPFAKNVLNVNRNWKSGFKRSQRENTFKPSIGLWVNQVKHDMELLLKSKISVMAQYGEQNQIFNWLGGHAALQSLEWDGQKQFGKLKQENLQSMKNRREIIGKFKRVKNLTFYKINDAGGLSGMDKPKEMFDIFVDFLENSLL